MGLLARGVCALGFEPIYELDVPLRWHLPLPRLRIKARRGLSIPLTRLAWMLAIASDFAFPAIFTSPLFSFVSLRLSLQARIC